MLAEDIEVTMPSYIPGVPLLLKEIVDALIAIIMMSEHHLDPIKEKTLLHRLIHNHTYDIRCQALQSLNQWTKKSLKEDSDINSSIIPFLTEYDNLDTVISILSSVVLTVDFSDEYLAEVNPISLCCIAIIQIFVLSKLVFLMKLIINSFDSNLF